MGCHAIEFFRWILGDPTTGAKARIASVYAQMGTYVHGDKTDGDDEALLILTFDSGAVGLAEESWTKPGGMDDRAEVFGSDGQALVWLSDDENHIMLQMKSKLSIGSLSLYLKSYRPGKTEKTPTPER